MPLPTELLLKKEELGPGSEGMGARKLLGLVREEEQESMAHRNVGKPLPTARGWENTDTISLPR